MKFDIGDLVYIRYHADDEKEAYAERFRIRWDSEMDEFEGHVGVIKQSDTCLTCEQYRVDYDGEEFWFSVSSLEAYEPTLAIGTKVLVRPHSQEEKQQYQSQYRLYWKKSMDAYEDHIGVIEKCDINYGYPVYAVSDGGDYWWFAESSLIPLEYDVF